MNRMVLVLVLTMVGCVPASGFGGSGRSLEDAAPADSCDTVGSPAWAACEGAVEEFQACCFAGGVSRTAYYQALTPESLCRAIVDRGQDPVTVCGQLGGVAGDCSGARLLGPRGTVTGVPACCCPPGAQNCGAPVGMPGFVCR